MKKTPTIKFSWRKFFLSALVATPLATLPSALWAVPQTGANVTSTAGASTLYTTIGNTLNISTPDRTVLTWTLFGSGASAFASTDTVIYDLPASTSAVLNIVNTGTTTIAGTLTSNGSVYILNKNGITVDASTAVINVANLGLSTVDEAPYNFQATGTLGYVGTATTDVNILGGGTGNITATNNGTVTIVGKNAALAGTIIAGALNVTTQNGTVTLGDVANNTFALGNSTTKSGNLTVSTGGGAIDLSKGTGTVTIYGGTANLTTSGGAVGQTSTGAFKVGKSDADGTLTINAGAGAVTLTKIDTNASDKTLKTTITAAGATTLGVDTGDITLNASTINGNLIVANAAGQIKSGGNVTLTGAARTISLAAKADKDITYSGTGNLTFASLATTTVVGTFDNTVSLTSTSGSVSLPGAADSAASPITYKNLSVTASGNITQSAAITATGGTVTFDAGDTLTMNTFANTLPKLVIKNAPNGATVDATGGAVILAKNSNATGNVTISSGSTFAFGTAFDDTIRFTNLTLNGAGAITDDSDNVTISGALTMTPGAANNVTLNGKATNATGIGLNSNFGQVNITNGTNATVYGKSGLNLGAINISGNLLAISTVGNITNSGQLNVDGWITAGAGTAVAPSDISLDFTAAAGSGNQITGSIYLQDDINLLLGTTVAGGATTIGNYMAKNVSVVNESATTVAAIKSTYLTGISGNLTVNSAGVTLAGDTVLGGSANLTSSAAITATAGTNTIGTYNVTAAKTTAGDVAIAVKSSGSTTVNATLSGAAGNGSTATFTSTGGNVTLGTVTSNYGGLVTFDARGGGSIADSAVGGLQIYGPVKFDAKNDVKVNKGGNNFGGVTMDNNADDKTLELSESGTLKIVSINTTDKKTTVSLTSQNGSIIEVAGATIKGTASTEKALTLSAPNGSVTLNQAANHTYKSPINVSSVGGNVTFASNDDAILGNVTIPSGTLTVDVSNTANKKLTQASSTSAYVYGNVTVKAAGTGVITLGNNGNRFGALAIANGSGNVTVTEDTTMNLQSIATTGNLTLKSNNGSIIDSTNASLPAGFTNSIAATGGAGKVATFTANSGNITLSLANSEFRTVALNTAVGNASVTSNAAGSDLDLGASTVGGTLSVINNSSNKNITQSGALAVTGDVSFTTSGATSGIILTNPSNALGGLRFVTGSTGASITESTTMNLKGGSVSTGPVVFSTGGNFQTSGPGGSSITSDLSISAAGTIIPSAGSLLVTGTFTVFSNSTKDLSALSKSGNLVGKDPVNLGTGSYTQPSP